MSDDSEGLVSSCATFTTLLFNVGLDIAEEDISAALTLDLQKSLGPTSVHSIFALQNLVQKHVVISFFSEYISI